MVLTSGALWWAFPGASVLGRIPSLLRRFNSLFGCLGNFRVRCSKINHLAERIRP
jgi:hypothetical protein